MTENKLIFISVIFVTFVVLRIVFKKLLPIFLDKFKDKTTFYYNVLKITKRPIDYLIIVIGLITILNVLNLHTNMDDMITSILRSAFAFGIFWLIYNVLTPFSIVINQFTKKLGKELGSDINNFIIKTLKFLVLSIGFMSIIQEWGYNVSGFLASLGLVGMAFALAAKDTASNLFGSLVIFSDKPFKVNDWIKTPDVEGVVESIGIRSTQIRTFAQALVSVPNGILANSAILNWSAMGKRRIKMTLGLTYDTSSLKIKQIINDIEKMLKTHNDIDQNTIYIYFTNLNDSSLGIFCYYFTKTTKWNEYMAVRQDTNLKIMKIVEDNKSQFAFPTQTLHLPNNSNVNHIENGKVD